MDKQTTGLLNEMNRAIIQFRGIYSSWSLSHNISYNEMLVMYTIREYGYCTQKQICDNYLLPRQTMNHVISIMRQKGLLKMNKDYCTGREKAFVLTEKGNDYAAPFLKSLNEIEIRAIELLGRKKLESATLLLHEYTQALKQALKEFETEAE